MAQLKYWNGTAWVDAVVGSQGVQGVQGALGTQGTSGIVAQDEAPLDTSVLWLDTDEPADEVLGANLFDAKGDLLVGTGAGTLDNLAVGANGQFLQADSTQTTGLKWSPVDLSSYVTLTGTQTLTNKTLSAPILVSPEERPTISATAATGTVNIDCSTSTLVYFTANATANWTLNFRGNSGTPLADVLNIGDSITVAFLVTNGSTAYYPTAFQIDGISVTPKWSGGTAPAAGNASSIDAYSFTIIQTADSVYTVLAAGPIKYA